MKDSGRTSWLDFFKCLPSSLLISAVFGIMITLVVSFVAYLSSLPPFAYVIINLVISVMMAFICGFHAAKCVRKNGLLLGALCGTLTFLLLFLIGLFVKESVGAVGGNLTKWVLMAVAGGIGGICGVNAHTKKR